MMTSRGLGMNGINVFMFNPIPLSIKHLLHQKLFQGKDSHQFEIRVLFNVITQIKDQMIKI